MLAKVCSAAVNGIEAYPVEVEVNAGYGDTLIVIVGLPDAAVKESRDRVMTALINSGFSFTFGRTTINLAPADVKKEGPSFDLPIAVGMAAASEQMEPDQLENFVWLANSRSMAPCDRSKGYCPWRFAPGSRGGPASWFHQKTQPRPASFRDCRSSP
jgi:magnesium chelatase family protein